MRNGKALRRVNGGFTLIELAVAIMVLMIFALAAWSGVSFLTGRAALAAAMSDAEQIQKGVVMYSTEQGGSLPTQISDLWTNSVRPYVRPQSGGIWSTRIGASGLDSHYKLARVSVAGRTYIGLVITNVDPGYAKSFDENMDGKPISPNSGVCLNASGITFPARGADEMRGTVNVTPKTEWNETTQSTVLVLISPL